jgi:hypothetical protein
MLVYQNVESLNAEDSLLKRIHPFGRSSSETKEHVCVHNPQNQNSENNSAPKGEIEQTIPDMS